MFVLPMGYYNIPDDEIVYVESLDCSWRLPYGQIKDDVASGYTVLFYAKQLEPK